MTSNHDYFTPEQIDEQIEELRQGKSSHKADAESQLVDALQDYYIIPITVEDRIHLEHARQRITGIQSNAEIDEQAPPLATMGKSRPRSSSRSTRLMRLLSGLAAVLIVSTLIGGWIMLTHLKNVPAVPNSGPADIYTIHSGIAYRIDGASGKVVWQHPVPSKKPADPNQGNSASLQVMNHIVYAVRDFDIYALNASNGTQIWHVNSQSNRAYFYFTVDGGRLYLFSLDKTFSALDARTGTELWHNTTFITENGYGFTVHNGNLYTDRGINDQQVMASLDGTTGALRWTASLAQDSLLDAPLVENGMVYYASGSIFSAVKESNGEILWTQALPGSGILTDAYLAHGILYLNTSSMIMESSTDTRKIFALDARSGHILWTSEPGYNKFTLPTTDGLLLTSRQHNGIYSIAGLNAQTGKVVWSVPFPCGIEHFSPKLLYPKCSVIWRDVINGKLYLLESNKQSPGPGQAPGIQTTYTLKVFNPATGDLFSEHPVAIKGDYPNMIGTNNGLLYIRDNIPRRANTIPYSDTVFVVYSLNDGSVVWQHAMPPFPAPTSANTSPATSGPVLAP